MNLQKAWIFILLIFSSVFLLSCEEENDNKVARAQECLNHATPATAQTCFDMVAGINTQHANVVKCGASFLTGGLTSDKIATAFENSKDASDADKESVLIEALAFTDNTPAVDINAANNAYTYCSLSQLPGLNYVAALCRVGTMVVNATGGTGDPGGIDSDLTNCVNTPANCDMDAIGQTVVELSDLYCAGEAADDQICTDINSAIANNAPGDYEAIAAALLLYFDPNP